LASTIRTEYPKIEIEIIDANPTNLIKKKYGPDISKAVLNYYKQRGIKFVLSNGFSSFALDKLQVDTVKG